MQFTMMNQIAMIFVDGFFIYYIARAFVRLLGRKNKKLLLLLVGLVASLLLSSHYAFFTHFIKEQNYHEFFKVDRAYTSDILTKKMRQVLSLYHPDKNPESNLDKFNQITDMRNVLSDPHYQKVYDIFGPFQYVEQTKQKDYTGIKNQLALGAYINSISFFSVFFIISIVLSYGQRFSKYRILSSFILLGLLIQDLYYYGEVDEEYDGTKTGQRQQKFEVKRDFYDDYFPNYTIFERLQLIRILCAGLLTALRLYFDCLVEEPVNKYEDQVDKQIDLIYEKVLKQTQPFQVDPNNPPKEGDQPKVFELKEFINNKEDLLKLKELALKHKEDIPKEKLAWLKKLFKFCLFMLFLYSVFRHYFEEDQDDNSLKTQKQKQNYQQQRQQHHHHQYQEDDIY